MSLGKLCREFGGEVVMAGERGSGRGRLCMVGLLAMGMACADTDSLEGPDPDNTLVGLLARFSNTVSPDIEWRLGAQLAVEEINGEGGIFGTDLELVVRDTRNRSEVPAEEARSLIDDLGVVAIVGPSRSSATLEVATEVSVRRGVPIVSGSATSPVISDLDDDGLVWRTALSDALQGVVAADYAVDTIGASTVGILHLDDPYGAGLAASFEARFEELIGDGAVLASVSYADLADYSAFDFVPLLAELFRDRPELIYLITFASDGARITRTIASEGLFDGDYRPRLMGVDGNRKEGLIVNGDPGILDGMVGTIPEPDPEDLRFQGFRERFRDRFGDFPGSPRAATNYDAIYLLAYGMVRARAPDPGRISESLQAVSVGGAPVGPNAFARGRALLDAGEEIDYQGASSDVDLDARGDVIGGNYTFWEIRDRRFAFLENRALRR